MPESPFDSIRRRVLTFAKNESFFPIYLYSLSGRELRLVECIPMPQSG